MHRISRFFLTKNFWLVIPLSIRLSHKSLCVLSSSADYLKNNLISMMVL